MNYNIIYERENIKYFKVTMLKLKNDTFYITTTRFNNDTYRQNERFRTNNNISGCVYGTPHEMPTYIPINGKVFVFEMNNSKNQIEGIGYMYNRLYTRKRLRIYKDNNYNRYSYLGKHRVDREDMTGKQLIDLEVIEDLVFKGYGHLKRGQGITSFTQKKVDDNKKFIISFLVKLFIN